MMYEQQIKNDELPLPTKKVQERTAATMTRNSEVGTST
jgi:hypothetical protein